MAVLADSDRNDCWADLMRRRIGPLSITKADLRAVVNAIDDWIVANASSLNTTIPQPGRAGLSSEDKALVFSAVLLKRYEKGA